MKQEVSEHHGALRQMRLSHEGIRTRGNGARYHLYECRRYSGTRWEETAPAKIAALLAAAGYVETKVDESLDNHGHVYHRVRRHERDASVVLVTLSVSSRTGSEVERIFKLADYFDGMDGDPNRPRLSLGDIAWAMSAGMSGQTPACMR